mgnify:CR=1 FL=1
MFHILIGGLIIAMMTSMLEYLIHSRIRKKSYKLKVMRITLFQLCLGSKYLVTTYDRDFSFFFIFFSQKAKTLLGELGKKLNGKKPTHAVENIYSGEETPLRPNQLPGAQENRGVRNCIVMRCNWINAITVRYFVCIG